MIVRQAFGEIKAALLQGFHCLKHLKHIHARLFRFSLDHDDYLLRLLLHSTFTIRGADYAKLVFDLVHDPNISLWNTMIQGLVSNDCFDQAIEYFRSMYREGRLPNNFTFPFILKACTRLSNYTSGVNVHTLVVKAGSDTDVFVNNGLVSFYSRCGYLEDARKVFDSISEKNVVSWTAIITAYIDSTRYRDAIELFSKSLTMGLRPDSVILVRALSACAKLGNSSAAELIYTCIRDTGMQKNAFVGTSLVDLYTKCGNMEKARAIFDEMPEKDTVSWSAMINGYAANGFPKEALETFFKMQRESIRPDQRCMVGVLSACASMGALELGEWASSLMDKNDLTEPFLGTALMDMYAKCGKIASAWEVFQGVKDKDLVVWNAIMSGLAMMGNVQTAFGCFAQLEKLGFVPNGNTFTALFCGCTHSGAVNDGRKLFFNMKHVYSIDPTIVHYGCMVDLFARSGLLTEAYQLIDKMPMQPNSVVWGALLAGCRLHRNAQMAEHVAEKIIELEPWNSMNYVLLCNIYSANHKWNNSKKIRRVMNERGIQKVRASSWIEFNGTVHEFRAGDMSHPMSDKIYAKLEELNKELNAMGFVPTTEFVLFDIEEEEKEHALVYHSEKLALAFALITTGPTEVVRIVKNLRVCGDCHMAFRLISETTGREIVVRDTNRFHHFIDGTCSCKDFW